MGSLGLDPLGIWASGTPPGSAQGAQGLDPAAVPMDPREASAAPIDVARILTPKDFERIRRLKAQQAERQALQGANRRRAEELALDDSDSDEALHESAVAIEGEAVNPLDIAGVQARHPHLCTWPNSLSLSLSNVSLSPAALLLRATRLPPSLFPAGAARRDTRGKARIDARRARRPAAVRPPIEEKDGRVDE